MAALRIYNSGHACFWFRNLQPSAKKHTILRNFPVIGYVRYMMEMIAPELHQYFVESGVDGTPVDRNHSSYIYERAKRQNKTHLLVPS